MNLRRLSKITLFAVFAVLVTVGTYAVVARRVTPSDQQLSPASSSAGTSVPVTPTSKTVTEDWPIYSNSILGISVQYPLTWNAQEDVESASSGPIVNFVPPNAEPFLVYLTINFDDRLWSGIEGVKEFYQRLGSESNFTVVAEEMIIGGYTAYAFLRSDMSNSTREVYLFKDGKTYNFTTNKYDLDEVKQMFESIGFQ